MNGSSRARLGIEPGSLSPLLFLGFAVASIGGPLALVALYLPGAAGGTIASAGLTAFLAVLFFCVPIAVWYGYSRSIASSGGLFSFVQAAAGDPLAHLQGWIWTISYFLYLPYTVTDVAYELMPAVFPGMTPYRSLVELLLPLAIVAAVALAMQGVLWALLVSAVLQLGFLLVLGTLAIAHEGTPARSVSPHHGAHALGAGAATVSLLFVCASLPLFLGGEVRGGARTVRRGLVGAFGVVAALFVFAAVPLAGLAASPALGEEVPGMAIIESFGHHRLAVATGVVAIVSVVGLIVAELVALTRLLPTMLGGSVRRATIAIAVPFVALDAISLINPDRFYADSLRPSLAALYISQILVFAVFPLLRTRRGGRTHALDVALAAGASALMGYGLYLVVTNQLAG